MAKKIEITTTVRENFGLRLKASTAAKAGFVILFYRVIFGWSSDL